MQDRRLPVREGERDRAGHDDARRLRENGSHKADALADATPDEDPATREAQYKDWINGARCEPEKGQRPSVEALLHHLVPARYVVHSHATIANTLTCHAGGQSLAERIFGDDVVWVPYVDPGFILAQTLKRSLEEYRAARVANWRRRS